MKVAAVQHDIVWEDTEATLAHVAPLVERAAAAGARLVLLTEMFATGFSMATERIAAPVDGAAARFLAVHARRLGIWIGGSISTLPAGAGQPVNRFVLAAPDGTGVHYDKIHPFRHGGEHHHYAAGKEPTVAVVDGVRVGLSVCYDLRFADLYWSQAHEVDAYAVVANWPAARRDHWTSLLTARAIENQAYVIAANRVGDGGGLHYEGDSRIIDPSGHSLAEASGGEAVLVADVDPDVVRATRDKFRFLADR